MRSSYGYTPGTPPEKPKFVAREAVRTHKLA